MRFEIFRVTDGMTPVVAVGPEPATTATFPLRVVSQVVSMRTVDVLRRPISSQTCAVLALILSGVDAAISIVLSTNESVTDGDPSPSGLMEGEHSAVASVDGYRRRRGDNFPLGQGSHGI